MPRQDNRARKIRTSDIVGLRTGTAQSSSSIISETNISNEQDAFAYMESHSNLVLPVYYGQERWITPVAYAPGLASGSYLTINYNDQILKSNDLYILTQKDGKFYPKKKGVWQISATCLSVPVTPASTGWVTNALYLYKNGLPYSILDTENTMTQYGIGNNYYFPNSFLQGTDLIYIDDDDYLEIKYTFSGANPLGVGDTLAGYINLGYTTNQTEIVP